VTTGRTGRIRRTESTFHADLMASYYAAREAQDAAAEAETYGYETELAEYWLTHRRVTFREWLQAYAAEYRDAER
jgi:phage terminase Nu1 subunit (DNA packaging protein)